MADKPLSGKPAERKQFSLAWALAVSVLVHVIIALIGGWLPVVRSSAAAEPEETVLKFSFAQPAESEADSAPAGDVPFETTPAPQPEIVPPTEPTAPQTAPVQDSATDQATAVPTGPIVEDPIEEPLEEVDAPAEDRLDPSTPEMPEDEQDPVFQQARESEESEDATSPQPQTKSYDLDGAIQDFGRALDHARAATPPPDSVNGPPRNVFVPDPAEINTTGYGLGNLTFETADFDWSDYARSVYTQIWRAWHNRLLRMTNEFEKWAYVNREPSLRHANQIRFVIERSGQVTGILVEGPSGCVPLDDSATQALAEVILPPLPDAFPKEREIVHARFIAIGEIRYMKPALTRMKALNYF